MALPSFRLDEQTALVTGAPAGSAAASLSDWPPPALMSHASTSPSQL